MQKSSLEKKKVLWIQQRNLKARFSATLTSEASLEFSNLLFICFQPGMEETQMADKYYHKSVLHFTVSLSSISYELPSQMFFVMGVLITCRKFLMPTAFSSLLPWIGYPESSLAFLHMFYFDGLFHICCNAVSGQQCYIGQPYGSLLWCGKWKEYNLEHSWLAAWKDKTCSTCHIKGYYCS